MIGHACTLSRTNGGGIVWLCECGQIGDVIPLVETSKAVTARSRRRVELTESIARVRHGAHVIQVQADVVAQSDRHLANVGAAIRSSNQILQRRGRWGHP